MKFVEPVIFGCLFILQGLPLQTLFAYQVVHVAAYATSKLFGHVDYLLPWETFLHGTDYLCRVVVVIVQKAIIFTWID